MLVTFVAVAAFSLLLSPGPGNPRDFGLSRTLALALEVLGKELEYALSPILWRLCQHHSRRILLPSAPTSA